MHLRDFGGREDQNALMNDMANASEEIAKTIIAGRRYLCLYLVDMYFGVLDEQERGDAVREKLQGDFDAAVADFMERSGLERGQLETLDAADWLAFQLGRDMGFFRTPDSGRDSIGDVPVE